MHARTRPARGKGTAAAWMVLANLVLVNLLLVGLVFFVGRAIFSALGFAPPGGRRDQAAAARAPGTVEGVLVGTNGRDVATPFAGRVSEVSVRPGERVRRGQPLFAMDAEELHRKIRIARGSPARAEAALRRAREERERALRPLKEEIAAMERRADAYRQDARRHEARYLALARQRPGRSRDRQMSAARKAQQRAESLLAQVKWKHGQAHGRLAQVERRWWSRVAAAQERFDLASRGPGPLLPLLKRAKLYSPTAGVVSSVRLRKGEWVAANRPAVRIDDPGGFRIVALVPEDARGSLEKGVRLPVRWGDRESRAELVKIEAGWGRHLFHYWLYLKPEDQKAVAPDQKVHIVLAPARGPAERQVARRRGAAE